MKVVGFHRTALSRQVGEAVRIMRRGIVLNSKSEFSRCKISRLSLEQLDGDKGREGDGKGLGDELRKDWTIGMLQKRDGVDRESRKQLGRVIRTKRSKGSGEDPDVPKKVKRRKY